MTLKTIYAFKHFDLFRSFVLERHRIYQRRRAQKTRPWTKDPILAQYKFTNVYRELDRVTEWIRKNWRDPFEKDIDLWFSMVVARLVNHPDTLTELSLPGRWNASQFCRVLHKRQAAGVKTFGSAYIVSTNGESMDKAEYLAEYVLDPLWKARDIIRPQPRDSLFQFCARLKAYQGMGTFIAGQVVADVKYVAPLNRAVDWWTWATSGPGSRKGMSYLLGYDPESRWKEHEWKEALDELMVLMTPIISHAGFPRLHAQDLQNCLCEFSKYRRTQLGTGRPKQKFVPFGEEE